MASRPVVADEEYTLETRDASPAHFLTKIKSFSLLSERGISHVESMEFQAADYKWKLIIYPDGDDKAKEEDHISMYLSMVETTSLPANWELNVIFNFFVYDHISDKYLCFRGKIRRFHAVNSKWGISKLMAKKTFTNPSNGYLLDDNSIFGAEVFVIKNERVIENVSVLPIKDAYNREWKIANFSNGEAWYSEEFVAGGIKWMIKVYPDGDTTVRGRYISIFLHCLDVKSLAAHKKVKAAGIFMVKSVLPDQKNHTKELLSNWFTSSGSNWGFTKFMAIGDYSKSFIANDSCLLEIQLSVEAIQEAA